MMFVFEAANGQLWPRTRGSVLPSLSIVPLQYSGTFN